MIDPQELESAAKDIKARTGHLVVRVEFEVRVLSDDSVRTCFYAMSGGYGEEAEACHQADTLGVAVEGCIADVQHKRRTELEKAREKVRKLEAQAA